MTMPPKPTPREKVSDVYASVYMRRADDAIFNRLRGGKNRVQFMTELLAEKACEHPIKQRVPHVAMYRADGEAINMNDPMSNETVRGYYCKACGRFIFPEPIA